MGVFLKLVAPYEVGGHTVNVLEAVGAIVRHRYYVSVDGKFRESQAKALNAGQVNVLGLTRTEALEDARVLVERIGSLGEAAEAAARLAATRPTSDNNHTAKLQLARFQNYLAGYRWEVAL